MAFNKRSLNEVSHTHERTCSQAVLYAHRLLSLYCNALGAWQFKCYDVSVVYNVTITYLALMSACDKDQHSAGSDGCTKLVLVLAEELLSWM